MGITDDMADAMREAKKNEERDTEDKIKKGIEESLDMLSSIGGESSEDESSDSES